jgi:hypothetical protein
MDPVDGSNIEHDVELDDDDLSPRVRRFLESIVDRDEHGLAPADRRRIVDRERRVSRFSWTCEELNVAFADLRTDAETIVLLGDHGVRATLVEIQAQVAALLAAIEGAGTAD